MIWQYIVCDSDGSVLDYTKEWMEKVNRGGLFPLNNVTFQMFVGIEKATRFRLRRHLVGRHDHDLKDIIDSIVKTDDVQWHWLLISQSVESSDDSDWLLRKLLLCDCKGFLYGSELDGGL